MRSEKKTQHNYPIQPFCGFHKFFSPPVKICMICVCLPWMCRNNTLGKTYTELQQHSKKIVRLVREVCGGNTVGCVFGLDLDFNSNFNEIQRLDIKTVRFKYRICRFKISWTNLQYARVLGCARVQIINISCVLAALWWGANVNGSAMASKNK